MPDDETQEVPLPPGTIPDQESVITQEIPVRDVFPEIRLVSPVKVELPPLHLRNDPIMTMDAPVADDTCLYDQLNPPAQTPLPKRPRRRMQTADRFLLCMGAAAFGLGTVAYGMVVHGWGAGPIPGGDEAQERPRVIRTDEPAVLPTTDYSPEPEKVVKVVGDPTSWSPEPEESVVVVSPTPTPTEAPSVLETAEETTEAPEPSPTPTKPSTPPPSPTPVPTPTYASPSPTPSQSTTPVIPPITLSASSTPEESP